MPIRKHDAVDNAVHVADARGNHWDGRKQHGREDTGQEQVEQKRSKTVVLNDMVVEIQTEVHHRYFQHEVYVLIKQRHFPFSFFRSLLVVVQLSSQNR